ncbi:hypothetical protein [Bacillus cereus]|uniref:hypothetical protein n=1 Tax=Bacillus cereus TaxID=1396 RepID=UPI000B4A81DB|nr:hypothetical protein [Bacillus cereus]
MVQALDDKIKCIIEQAQQELSSKFIVETENNNGHNRLRNFEINLRRNYLQGTEVKDSIDTVGLNGFKQQGNIQVTGNSVGFGEERTLIFGKPNEVKGNYPICNNTVSVYKAELQQYSQIQFPLK